jgi:hypothetical protein
MTPAPVRDAGWAARVIDAGVRLDLIERASDDDAFAQLGATIMRAVSKAELSDEDVYPLLVRFWNGRWPPARWPPHAPAVARRCGHGAGRPRIVRAGDLHVRPER